MTDWNALWQTLLALAMIALTIGCAEETTQEKATISDSGALDGERHRIVISTDIGGTDPDDFQSMVHLLLYADVLDIEGLISSPYGPGRKADILEVIDYYEQDYLNLKSYSDRYPSPDSLRSITKQGAIDRAGYQGYRASTEGSDLIIKRARAEDPRPLHVLVWGGIEDLAQALHDAPDILPKLRVYWIGGPNKKWSPDAYQYIVNNYPKLHIIETNAAYRGWFVGGNQEGQWSNSAFVEKYVAGKGALGSFFATQLGGEIKMGDTPSVAWLLKGNPEDPSQPSWGGKFVRAWDRPYYQFDKLPSKADSIQEFGIMELVLPLGTDLPDNPKASLEVTNQSLGGYFPGDGTVRFRFSPKSAEPYDFEIKSNVPSLDGKVGGITAVMVSPAAADHPSEEYSNWWTDDPAEQFIEDGHIGAKTVSRWREDFLWNFAERIERCIIQGKYSN
ncbi:MAG TPA: nucleoside hydrolase-like domain-containing protein [Fodinibius sp.]|nr:nucleoside hydrolase-like domain-containing protein [Fodinibius sp.]